MYFSFVFVTSSWRRQIVLFGSDGQPSVVDQLAEIHRIACSLRNLTDQSKPNAYVVCELHLEAGDLLLRLINPDLPFDFGQVLGVNRVARFVIWKRRVSNDDRLPAVVFLSFGIIERKCLCELARTPLVP